MENKSENKELVEQPGDNVPQSAGFQSAQNFELMQRMAKLLSASELIPKEFKNNIPNTVIALEMAHRVQASPLAVMQNLYIVHGKPSWSSQFIIAAINNTGNFSPLRFDMKGENDNRTCMAWAVEKATGERLEGPPVTMAMAKQEGWLDKNGSKWKTMPELMLRYRAGTFFGRLYAPEILMGMQSVDEVRDIIDVTPKSGGAQDLMSRMEEKEEKPQKKKEPAKKETSKKEGHGKEAPAKSIKDELAAAVRKHFDGDMVEMQKYLGSKDIDDIKDATDGQCQDALEGLKA